MGKRPKEHIRDGRERLWKKFNERNVGFTHLARITNLSQLVAQITLIDGVEQIGWYQNDEELASVYTLNKCLVLLDRYTLGHCSSEDEEQTLDEVLCVSGPSWPEVCEVVASLELHLGNFSEQGASRA